jgi:hypothetical protein
VDISRQIKGEKSVVRSWTLGETLREKASVEELKLPNAKVPKWTRTIDLRWAHASNPEFRVRNTPKESRE